MPAVYKQSVKEWWISLVAGIIYVITGGLVLTYPLEAYNSLTTLFIIGFGIIGLLGLYYAISNRKRLQHWEWTLVTALIDLAISFLLLTNQETALKILPLYVGFVLLFRSIVGIGFSTYLAHYKVRNWWIVLILSMLGVIFSLLMIWNPEYGLLNLIFYTGIALLATGFAQIGVAYELRRYENRRD